MTREEVKALVAKVKYRSWRIWVDDSGDVKVAAPVDCAYARGKRRRTTVYGYVVSPHAYQHEDALLRAIRGAISAVLHHEMSEWFKYKGKRYFDAGH